MRYRMVGHGFAFLAFSLMGISAWAGSQLVMPSAGTRAYVLLTNRGTADASFVFDKLLAAPKADGPYFKKSIATSSRNFSIECRQMVEKTANVACTLTFATDVGGSGIYLDPANQHVLGKLGSELNSLFQPTDPNGELSPDGTLKICASCGPNRDLLDVEWSR